MTDQASPRWKLLTARPSPMYREVNWSPAVEIEVTHSRFDAPSWHPCCHGTFIDRHVVPGSRLVDLPVFGRDYPGCDAIGDGASVSLASGPRTDGAGQGGELYQEQDGRTRFQRDWDFLAFHAERALERYRSHALPLVSGESYLRAESELTEWRKAEALALYARNWKTRIPKLGESNHPVDTLLYSYHCAGAAEVLFALATVVGLEARRITVSHHSMVEILVGDAWVWCDNIVSGTPILPASYRDVLERLSQWPSLSRKQIDMFSGKEPFYRCPFEMDQRLSWRSGGFSGQGRGEGDVREGIGLSLAYNPATATALYNHAAEHRFPGLARDGSPSLILKEKQGWIHCDALLAGEEALRSRYFLSACEDNPVRSAELRVWLAPGFEPDSLSVEVDGTAHPW